MTFLLNIWTAPKMMLLFWQIKRRLVLLRQQQHFAARFELKRLRNFQLFCLAWQPRRLVRSFFRQMRAHIASLKLQFKCGFQQKKIIQESLTYSLALNWKYDIVAIDSYDAFHIRANWCVHFMGKNKFSKNSLYDIL